MNAVRRPRITLTATDAGRLAGLAATMSSRMPEVADDLLAEVERASVVADGRAPADVVRMGSFASYEVGGEVRDVTLVWPGEADIGLGKVSVMTPIGTALLGMKPGQSISYKSRDGRSHLLSVVSVLQPTAAEEPARAMAAA